MNYEIKNNDLLTGEDNGGIWILTSGTRNPTTAFENTANTFATKEQPLEHLFSNINSEQQLVAMQKTYPLPFKIVVFRKYVRL